MESDGIIRNVPVSESITKQLDLWAQPVKKRSDHGFRMILLFVSMFTIFEGGVTYSSLSLRVVLSGSSTDPCSLLSENGVGALQFLDDWWPHLHVFKI